LPTPEKNESEKDFVDRCIPIVIADGTAKDGIQGSAICHSMFQQHHKKMAEDEEAARAYAQTLQNVEIFATGTWNGDPYTVADLDAMVEASKSLPLTSPVKLGHSDSQRWFGQGDGAPALGWVQNLRRTGSKLIADLVNVPNALVGLIRNGNYKNKSAEIYWNYIDPADVEKKKWPRVLKAVSILGADMPAVTSLEELQRVLMSDNSRHITYSGQAGELRVYTTPDNDGGNMDEKRYQEKIASLESQLNAEKALRETMEGRAVRAEANLATRDEDFAVKNFREVTVVALKQAGKVLPAEEESLVITFSALGPGSKRYGDKDVLPREMFVKSLYDRKPQLGFGGGANGGEDGGDGPAAVEVDKRIRKFVEKGDAKDYGEGKELVKTRFPELWERYIRG